MTQSGEQVNAKYRDLEILQLFLHLLDLAGYSYFLKHSKCPATARLPEDSPDLQPVPRPAPIKLDADQEREVGQAMAILADELRHVNRRPSHWRWCLAVMHRALGHALALRRPAGFIPGNGFGELTRLFDDVVVTMPELPQVRASVAEVERLRTTWITRGPTTWPVELKKLPGIFADCVQVVARLGVGDIDSALKRLGPLLRSPS